MGHVRGGRGSEHGPKMPFAKAWGWFKFRAYFLPGKLYFLYDLRGNRMLLYFYFVTIFTFIKPLSGKGRIPLSHRVRLNRRWPSITQFEWQFVQDTNLFNSVFRFWCSCRLDIYCQSLSFNAMILIQRYSKLSNNRTGRIPN